MNEEPRLIALDSSFELSEFPSESGEAPAAPAAAVPDAGDVSATMDTSALFATEQGDNGDDEADDREPRHGTHANIAEFPVRTPEPVAVHAASPPNAVTLVELIERHNGLDWREAVAVVHQVCLYLKARAPHPPILLDPRYIEIGASGDVRVVSSQPSSDPLVIQVGRLLRAILMGKQAPPELRLLLAQATFELPIFESIEDVDRALGQLERLDEKGPAGPTRLKEVAAQVDAPNEVLVDEPARTRPIMPAAARSGRRSKTRTSVGLRAAISTYGIQFAIISTALAILIVVVASRPSIIFPSAASESDPGSTGTDNRPVQIEKPSTTKPSVGAPVAGSSSQSVQSAAQPRTAGTASSPTTPSSTVNSRPRPDRILGSVATVPAAAPTAGVEAPKESPKDSERRATELISRGDAEKASNVFDTLVMSNPLYEPKTTDLTPEALAAFRRSQRLLLPLVATRTADRAGAALADGDAETATALGKQVLTILSRPEAGNPPHLREQVTDVIEKASVLQAAEEDIIYSDASVGVTPPRQISRGLPATSPIGIPPNRIGTLEMIIGRTGTVEFVKLHTPLNRHHERMIVSPAKAWLFRPAMKNGKPVRYRIVVRVNLPESGTN